MYVTVQPPAAMRRHLSARGQRCACLQPCLEAQHGSRFASEIILCALMSSSLLLEYEAWDFELQAQGGRVSFSASESLQRAQHSVTEQVQRTEECRKRHGI